MSRGEKEEWETWEKERSLFSHSPIPSLFLSASLSPTPSLLLGLLLLTVCL